MYEATKGQTSALPVLSRRNHLECFEIREDPTRWVYVSCMQKAPSPAARVRERAVSLFDVMDKVGTVVGFISCLGMVYLLIRMSCGVIW